jgi:hypothetical protein
MLERKLLFELHGHKKSVNCLVYTKNKKLISGGGDNDIIVWDLVR